VYLIQGEGEIARTGTLSTVTGAIDVGFIGLGAMGRPMALNLIKAGYPMAVYARRSESLGPLTSAGATPTASPAAVARSADVIFTMVTSSADSEEVTLGRGGVVEGLRKGAVIVDMATISPDVTRRIAAEVAARGAEHLDAPVSGGPAAAEAGTLSIMVGGPARTLSLVEPLLRCMGKTIAHMGDHGAGQTTKACNQLLLVVTAQAVAEALLLARRTGLDPAKVREVLLAGAASGRVLELFGARMVERAFRDGIDVRFFDKDLKIAIGLGTNAALDLPAAAVVRQQLNTIMAAGEGTSDLSILIRALERAGGDTE
jgi:2-hydroxy-3-oxopropionate reductase